MDLPTTNSTYSFSVRLSDLDDVRLPFIATASPPALKTFVAENLEIISSTFTPSLVSPPKRYHVEEARSTDTQLHMCLRHALNGEERSQNNKKTVSERLECLEDGERWFKEHLSELDMRLSEQNRHLSEQDKHLSDQKKHISEQLSEIRSDKKTYKAYEITKALTDGLNKSYAYLLDGVSHEDWSILLRSNMHQVSRILWAMKPSHLSYLLKHFPDHHLQNLVKSLAVYIRSQIADEEETLTICQVVYSSVRSPRNIIAHPVISEEDAQEWVRKKFKKLEKGGGLERLLEMILFLTVTGSPEERKFPPSCDISGEKRDWDGDDVAVDDVPDAKRPRNS